MNYRQRIKVWVDGFSEKQTLEADTNIKALTSAIRQPAAWDGGIRDLTLALGGRYLTLDQDKKWQFTADQSFKGGSEATLRAALNRALLAHVETGQATDQAAAIFDLLVAKDRWRQCLTSLDSSYAFALLAIHVAYITHNPDPKDPVTKVALPRIISGFRKVTSKWLGVNVGSQQPVSAWQMASMIFGREWCEFMLKDESMPTWEIMLMVERGRPAFAPGLIAPALEDYSEVLPDLSSEMHL